MNIFTLYEAYKFLFKRKKDGIIEWEIFNEQVLYINSHSWSTEALNKYEDKLEEIINQARKDKERIYQGCGSEDFILDAIKWGFTQSSLTNKEKVSPVKCTCVPLKSFDSIMNGYRDYNGKVCSEDEIKFANESLREFIDKYEKYLKKERKEYIRAFISLFILLLIIYFLI